MIAAITETGYENNGLYSHIASPSVQNLKFWLMT